MNSKRQPHALTPAQVELIESPASVLHVATASSALRPHLTYAYGCLVNRQTGVIAAGVAAAAAVDVLADVKENGRLALVACDIRTFKTIQLKGSDARASPADDAARARAAHFHRGFVEAAVSLGYVRDVMDRHMAVEAPDLLLIEFSVSQAFAQTPGAGAGAPIPPATGAA